MKRACVYIVLMTGLIAASIPATEFPEAEITNGIIHAKIYLPDSNNGYYRATRFDWSGVIASLNYKEHNYFGQWFEKYSPDIHDAIMGPVEDFSPVGYDEAKPGESFIKIGIGVLSKPDEAKYFFVTPYRIMNRGLWKIVTKHDEVQFTHTLNSGDYGYEYSKKVQMIRNKPEMVVVHSFKNTGRLAIETNVYDHNFFVIDSQLTGKNFEVRFPYTLTTDSAQVGSSGQLQGNRIVFTSDFTKNDHVYYKSLQGFGNDAKGYDISVENHKTGAGVRITGDRPLSKMVFWSAVKTVCPEPYIHFKVEPGKVFSWSITYRFYTCTITK